jgi:hypothetical protein
VVAGVPYGVYNVTFGIRWPLWNVQCDKLYQEALTEYRMQQMVSEYALLLYNATSGIREFPLSSMCDKCCNWATVQ